MGILGSNAVKVGLLVSVVAALIFAATGMFINCVSDAPCSLSNIASKESGDAGKYCKKICKTMKVFLIATHLLSFALFPYAIYVYSVRGKILEAMGAEDTLSCVLGFAFFMVSMTGEIGWHVSQQWFYQEEYHILNFLFYFFFMAASSCWANGLRSKTNNQSASYWLTIILVLSPVIATVVYALSATVKTVCTSSPSAAICKLEPTKVPIYILMALIYAILTYRLFKVLNGDIRVFLLPFFSVVINLVFIALLNSAIDSPFYNPLYHILHDLLGTLLGVFLITNLVWTLTEEPNTLKSERAALISSGSS